MRLNAAYPALLALLLTLALAGCRREQLSADGGVIRFQINTAEVSSALTKYDLPVVDDIPGDFLRKNTNTVRVWGTLDAGLLFDPYLVLTCDGNGSSANWSYAGDPYYWNLTAAYQFRSVFTNGHDSDIDNNSASASSVTVNYSGDYDLMVAATSIAASDAKSATLTFGHACSAVRFYCIDPTRSSTATTANFNINSFKLNNVAKTGTLTFSNGIAWTATPTAEAFTKPAAELPWSVPSNNDDAEAALTPWFFFVPQNLESNNASIEFSFAPAGPEYASIEQSVDIKYFLKDASASWEPGNMYTYFIVLDPAAIEFINFTVQPWPTDVVTGTYTVL